MPMKSVFVTLQAERVSVLAMNVFILVLLTLFPLSRHTTRQCNAMAYSTMNGLFYTVIYSPCDLHTVGENDSRAHRRKHDGLWDVLEDRTESYLRT